jgi:predicted PurR-regulated permease PerM
VVILKSFLKWLRRFLHDLLSVDEDNKSAIIFVFLLIAFVFAFIIIFSVVTNKPLSSKIIDSVQSAMNWLGATALGGHGITSVKNYKNTIKEKVTDFVEKI